MATFNLDTGRGGDGPGRQRLVATTATLGDGGTYDTGLTSITAAAVTCVTAGEMAEITGVSGGTLTVAVKDNAGSAGTSAAQHILAVGVN